ncbi:oxidoreductase [Ascochyta rabiei]|uniref:Oxidoreductase n=1 Tax=Didymella rabiei TaxID=5454 RepID=A0A162VVJ6_DIDRA|nr:oxidoreductase [Ascochyta rabiei]
MYSFYTSLAKSLFCLVFARVYKRQVVPTRDLKGQTAIVTGANSGIGLSVAVARTSQGATKCLAFRNPDRGAAAVDHVVVKCGDKSRERVTCTILDVGDLGSVHSFCQSWVQEYTKIDMLVHNAGIAAPPAGSSIKTNEGLEIMHTTNFLGSFLMTHLLEPHLSSRARVVITSSTDSYSAIAHFAYDVARTEGITAPGLFTQLIARSKAILGLEAASSAPAYGLSKAQQVLLASLLQQRLTAPATRATGRRMLLLWALRQRQFLANMTLHGRHGQ